MVAELGGSDWLAAVVADLPGWFSSTAASQLVTASVAAETTSPEMAALEQDIADADRVIALLQPAADQLRQLCALQAPTARSPSSDAGVPRFSSTVPGPRGVPAGQNPSKRRPSGRAYQPSAKRLRADQGIPVRVTLRSEGAPSSLDPR